MKVSENNHIFGINGIRVDLAINPKMGLGVIAEKDIKNDEIIEICPIVELSFRGRYQHEKIIKEYAFSIKCECEECSSHGYITYLVLGYGMIYNHRNKPNANWVLNSEKRYVEIKAIADIKKGEEIFIYYSDEYFENNQIIEFN